MKIGFIGYGNMASAIATAIVDEKLVANKDIYASARNYEKLVNNCSKININACKDNKDVIINSDFVILCVKPYMVEKVLEDNLKYLDNKVLISIVAGYDFDKYEKILNGIYPSYMAISCAEATSNNSNLTGIPFGNRKEGHTPDEVMINTRTEGFSELIRRRFVIGSFILQKENQEKLFKNAQRIRRLVVDAMTNLFKEYDGLIMPNAGSIAPRFTDEMDRLSEKYLLLENHLAIGNFGGFPSITIPSGIIDDMPVAINITGPIKTDDVVCNIANKLEEKIGFVPLSVKEEN